ncbi:hypothetical protein VTN31DRAFT_1988 [Thermomyces dupontii]|uniref:mitochondrial 54S ribosomal protein mL41 n=1 Tax=Talaromyces thermophilus TaxID=28565 RepID=UPI003744A0F5
MKPSQSLMARLRLTTKQVNKGYYKGTRSGSMGFWANNGSTYVIDWKKVRTYVVPENLKDFKLTPFVTRTMPPTPTKYAQENQPEDATMPLDRGFKGEDYLKLWALENGEEYLAFKQKEEEAKATASAAGDQSGGKESS